MMLVLEQFTFLIVNFFSKKILFFSLLVLLVFQSACISKNTGQNDILALTNETEKPSATPKQISNKLSQEELNDVKKLVGRYQAATEADKEMAKEIFNQAKRYFEQGKYTLAAEGFGESATIYPTVDSLIMNGESIARLDVTEHHEKERFEYKIKQFEDAAKLFESAKAFTLETFQQDFLKNHIKLDENIDCLKSFLNDKKTRCAYVSDILKANKIN